MRTFVAFLLQVVVILSGSTHALGNSLRGLQQAPTSPGVLFEIPLILSLHYLDEAAGSVLETGDGTIPLVHDFCLAVQELAGSNEVSVAAEDVGISIVISGCSIVETARTYDSAVPDSFTLEVSLVQVVHAAATNFTEALTPEPLLRKLVGNDTVTLDTLRALVGNVFSQATGSNSRFISLLQEKNAAFHLLSDVDVLLELTKLPPVSPAPTMFVPGTTLVTTELPTVSPSGAPSTSPSLQPTTAPSSSPSTSPSMLPSIGPSFPSAKRSTVHPAYLPSYAPSLQPSQGQPTSAPLSAAPTFALGPPSSTVEATFTPSVVFPSTSPTTTPRERVFAKPTAQPTPPPTIFVSPHLSNQPSSSRSELEPLVVAAIVVGIIAILVMCCCSFLGLYYLEHRDMEDHANDSEGLSASRQANLDPRIPQAQVGKKRHFGSRSSSNSKSTKADSRASKVSKNSKALPIIPDTVNVGDESMSLADTTLGEQTAGRDRTRPLKKKRFIDLEAAYLASPSFDEESLYTTGKKSSSNMYSLRPSSEINEDYMNQDDFYFSAAGKRGDSKGKVENVNHLGGISENSLIADRIVGLIDAELKEDDSDSNNSTFYMGDSNESPISVALSNCDRKRDVVDFDDIKVLIPTEDDHDACALLDEIQASDSDSLALLDAVSNVDAEGHGEEKLLTASSSSEGEDQDVLVAIHSKSFPTSPSDSRSSTTKRAGNLGAPSSMLGVDESDDDLPQPRLPVKRNVAKPWQATTLKYRTRPLDASVPKTPRHLVPMTTVTSAFPRGKSPVLHPSDTVEMPLSKGMDDSENSGSTCKDDDATPRAIEMNKPFGLATASVGSRGLSHHSYEEEKSNTDFENDLDQLEMHLSALHKPEDRPLSPLSVSTAGVVSQTGKRVRSTRHRVVVVAPPGKLGIILANRRGGTGTVISEVRQSSALIGALVAGDKLVAIDGQDVTGMLVSEITSIMASKSNHDRQLTIVTKKARTQA